MNERRDENWLNKKNYFFPKKWIQGWLCLSVSLSLSLSLSFTKIRIYYYGKKNYCGDSSTLHTLGQLSLNAEQIVYIMSCSSLSTEPYTSCGSSPWVQHSTSRTAHLLLDCSYYKQLSCNSKFILQYLFNSIFQ